MSIYRTLRVQRSNSLVVHSTIAHTDQPSTPLASALSEDEPVQYVQLGLSGGAGVLTRAEESALQKRVRILL
jgi:hypothetical protein